MQQSVEHIYSQRQLEQLISIKMKEIFDRRGVGYNSL